MSDKEIYEFLLNDKVQENLIITDDDGITFEMEELGIIPMHGVIYAVMDLLKINNIEVTEEEQGLVLLELDYDEELDEYYVATIEEDDLFNEVIEAFEQLPIE
ncbi:MAG: DUF1292 domain-containing protein [Candidatus Izemoplasmatales bacterium]|jgi:hypothetical protein|nr:DUF1292 domain-containing protein [Candidatus Izemoplasmatales bacterium]